jgi:hypothetical protein
VSEINTLSETEDSILVFGFEDDEFYEQCYCIKHGRRSNIDNGVSALSEILDEIHSYCYDSTKEVLIKYCNVMDEINELLTKLNF